MPGTLVSVDLDWLNRCSDLASDPIIKIGEILQYMRPSTPAMMTVEHHEFLPQLRRWIKSGIIKPPLNIINIDEHHDYYVNGGRYHPDGDLVNCGVWGYRIPTDWYKRYTWVHNNCQDSFCDWNYAQEWLEDHNIASSDRDNHRLSSLKTEIVAAVFCVSPDYLNSDVGEKIERITELIAQHFRLKRFPKRNNGNVFDIASWRMVSLKVSN